MRVLYDLGTFKAKTTGEMNTMAQNMVSCYEDKDREEENRILIRGLADGIMDLSKAENNEEELEALRNLKCLLDHAEMEFKMYRNKLAFARARTSVYASYIDEFNSAIEIF